MFNYFDVYYIVIYSETSEIAFSWKIDKEINLINEFAYDKGHKAGKIILS